MFSSEINSVPTGVSLLSLEEKSFATDLESYSTKHWNQKSKSGSSRNPDNRGSDNQGLTVVV